MNYSAIAHVLYQKKVGYIEEKPQVTIHGLNVGKNSWEKSELCYKKLLEDDFSR